MIIHEIFFIEKVELQEIKKKKDFLKLHLGFIEPNKLKFNFRLWDICEEIMNLNTE